MMRNEIWKEYPLNIAYAGNYRIEISNYGRVRSFNKISPEGRFLKGSLQGGYPIVRLKFFKPRTKTMLAKIEEYNTEIKLISEEIKTVRKEEENTERAFVLIEKLKAEKILITEKRSQYIKKTDKKRSVFFHFLIHRAVAELFLEKPKDADFVIHKDYKKDNNHVSNLQWMTKEDTYSRYSEMPHFTNKSLTSGSNARKRGTSKLQVNDILFIKEKLAQGKTLRSLATRFHVSDMQIHRIKTGENWSDVKTVSELKSRRNK